jgi:hypothetical protein
LGVPPLRHFSQLIKNHLQRRRAVRCNLFDASFLFSHEDTAKTSNLYVPAIKTKRVSASVPHATAINKAIHEAGIVP